MFTLSLKSLFSPRFLALPAIALAVIVALAQTASHNSGKMDVAGPTVVRAVNCSAPANAANPACTVAHNDLRTVR
jgi:hypothetical protein